MNEFVFKVYGSSAADETQRRGVGTAERVMYEIENMDCPTEEALIRKRLAPCPDAPATAQVSKSSAPSRGPISRDAGRVIYRIENMDCPSEEALIREKLGRLSGV